MPTYDSNEIAIKDIQWMWFLKNLNKKDFFFALFSVFFYK